MWFIIVIFFVSLAGLLALFGIKYLETKRGVVYGAGFRARADERARKVKSALVRNLLQLEEVPLTILLWIRAGIHMFAVWMAEMARNAESAAHALANFVAHQRHMEIRETRSDYLRHVGPPPEAAVAEVEDEPMEGVVEEPTENANHEKETEPAAEILGETRAEERAPEASHANEAVEVPHAGEVASPAVETAGERARRRVRSVFRHTPRIRANKKRDVDGGM